MANTYGHGTAGQHTCGACCSTCKSVTRTYALTSKDKANVAVIMDGIDPKYAAVLKAHSYSVGRKF